MKHADHHTTAKSIIAVLILMLALVMLLMFVQNKESLIVNDMLKPFVLMIAVGMGLLIGLFYLTSKPHHVAKSSGKRRKR